MGDKTALFDFPYPLGTDKVIDGDNAIRALAEAMEARLLALTSGGLMVASGVFAGISDGNAFVTIPVPTAWRTGGIRVQTMLIADANAGNDTITKITSGVVWDPYPLVAGATGALVRIRRFDTNDYFGGNPCTLHWIMTAQFISPTALDLPEALPAPGGGTPPEIEATPTKGND